MTDYLFPITAKGYSFILKTLQLIGRTACFTLLIMVLPHYAAAEEILALGEAVKIALENNYGITLARNDLDMARNNNSAGNAGFLPRIDAVAEYNKGELDAEVNTLLNTGLEKSGAKTELLTAGIMLKWTLFDGFNMFANSRYLKIQEEIGELNLKSSIENTIAKIIIQYYEIVRQAQVVSILQEQVGISEYRTQIAQLNFDTGMGSEFELMKSTVELNFDKLQLQKQSTGMANSKITLNELLSRDVNTEFTIQDSISISDMFNYASLEKRMRASNKNLLLAYKNKQLSEQEARKVLAKYFPTIDFKTGYTYYDFKTEASLINETKTYGFNIGLNANLNLFDGMNDKRRRENAEINIINNELRIKQLENHLDAYLARIYREYQDGLTLIELEKDNLELAKTNMDIAKESFSTGSISSLQFREVQRNLLDANMMLVNVKYHIKVKETELLLISGQVLSQD
ncbi:TolC family protein [candidate division KSB1 bacterium]|nr:TolC family protein [candidate division KSB1 bacterium]